MTSRYRRTLDYEHGVILGVEFEKDGREIIDYAVVLLLRVGDAVETIRLYDGAHGQNEMHRYGRSSGKQPGTTFHRGTLGEGMRAAVADIKIGYKKMIEGWERR